MKPVLKTANKNSALYYLDRKKYIMKHTAEIVKVYAKEIFFDKLHKTSSGVVVESPIQVSNFKLQNILV